ncbi:hypothetical protein AnigIFM50267_003817 [Aspergillus niger]|nr:hypothetical protein AnigIFM50267_003817 [Aspergillus niger]
MVSLTPSIRFHAAIRAKTPDTGATSDEVPGDVVVDRMLFHLAYRSNGIVHSACGDPGCPTSHRPRRSSHQYRPRCHSG